MSYNKFRERMKDTPLWEKLFLFVFVSIGVSLFILTLTHVPPLKSKIVKGCKCCEYYQSRHLNPLSKEIK